MKTIFLLILIATVSGCIFPGGRSRDVSGDERVAHHIGRVFITKYDLYLCEVDIDLDIYVFPEIKPPAGLLSGYGSPRLPYPVDAAHIGKKLGWYTIVGVLPTGTRMQIDRINYYKSPGLRAVTIIFRTDDAQNRTVQRQNHAHINDAKYKDFGLGDLWIIGRVADEVIAEEPHMVAPK